VGLTAHLRQKSEDAGAWACWHHHPCRSPPASPLTYRDLPCRPTTVLSLGKSKPPTPFATSNLCVSLLPLLAPPPLLLPLLSARRHRPHTQFISTAILIPLFPPPAKQPRDSTSSVPQLLCGCQKPIDPSNPPPPIRNAVHKAPPPAPTANQVPGQADAPSQSVPPPSLSTPYHPSLTHRQKSTPRPRPTPLRPRTPCPPHSPSTASRPSSTGP
jgi:hypothetical protein